jgi:hypothetical protein
MRKISRKGLIKKNWELCRQIKFIMVGRSCEACGQTNGLQVDHCFSRNDKMLFYRISNLTVLCELCHSHKTYRRKAMDLRVYELVEDREGKKEFNELRRIDEGISAFPDWQYLAYHMDMNEKLKEELEKLEGANGAEEANQGSSPTGKAVVGRTLRPRIKAEID